MVPQKMASRMQAAYKKAGQEGGGGTQAHSGAIVIFNIHDCSVGERFQRWRNGGTPRTNSVTLR